MAHNQIEVCACKQSDRIQNGLHSWGGADGAAVQPCGGVRRAAGRRLISQSLTSTITLLFWYLARNAHAENRNRVRATLCDACAAPVKYPEIYFPLKGDTERRLNFHFMVMMRLFRRRRRDRASEKVDGDRCCGTEFKWERVARAGKLRVCDINGHFYSCFSVNHPRWFIQTWRFSWIEAI
jgi:hypothetical protein